MPRLLRKIYARFMGLTARIDRGQVYFTSKELHRGMKADWNIGLVNTFPIKGGGIGIICSSSDKKICKGKRIWWIEDA